jgi:tetratricopeptide (TPR) repeat protein
MNGGQRAISGKQRGAVASAAAIAAFVLTWAVLTANNGTAPPLPSSSSAGDSVVRSNASTAEKIRLLRVQVQEGVGGADTHALLANAYLQRVRETGDVSLYVRAEDALRGIRGNAAVENARGTLALAKHDFRGGLRHGLAARRLAPQIVQPLNVINDAQVELGRYPDAARTLQTMMDLKPNLAAYSRVSYFRELHGDLDGATRAMRLAVSAGGEAPENVAFVQSLLGSLEFDRGHLDAASLAYRTALARLPSYRAARRGLGRVEAARGNLTAALRDQRATAGPSASPEDVIALHETELAAGERDAAAGALIRLRRMLEAEAARGVGNSNERALIEADYGDPRDAIALGRRGWAHAPSVTSADALGWAYTRAGYPVRGLAWARRALRIGSADRHFLYHAGIAARDAGQPRLARRWLTRAVAGNPRFSPLQGPRAERALRSVR